jgi:hypothetical protein
MKGRKRAKRRPTKRAAKNKKPYSMSAETGYFNVTGRAAERFVMPSGVMDRISKTSKRGRYHLKRVGIPIPSRKPGRPPKTKPE